MLLTIPLLKLNILTEVQRYKRNTYNWICVWRMNNTVHRLDDMQECKYNDSIFNNID